MLASVNHQMACVKIVSVAEESLEQADCLRCLAIPEPTKLLDLTTSDELSNSAHTEPV